MYFISLLSKGQHVAFTWQPICSILFDSIISSMRLYVGARGTNGPANFHAVEQVTKRQLSESGTSLFCLTALTICNPPRLIKVRCSALDTLVQRRGDGREARNAGRRRRGGDKPTERSRVSQMFRGARLGQSGHRQASGEGISGRGRKCGEFFSKHGFLKQLQGCSGLTHVNFITGLE